MTGIHQPLRHDLNALPAAAWQPLSDDVEAFLADFDRRSADPDADTGEQFAEQFLALDPNNATVVTRTALLAALPTRRHLFQRAGITAVHRRDARQLDLDPHHLLVTARWDAERQDQEPIRLESTFLLRHDAAGTRVMVYLNHYDILAGLAGASRND